MTSDAGARYDVLGVPVSVTSLAGASAAIRRWSQDGQGRFVCIRDVHGIMQSRADPALQALHGEAAMVTPDGMPLVWIGRRRGLPVERTCGPDLIDFAMRDGLADGLSHFLYGGKPGIAGRLRAVFELRHCGVRIVAAETPPFRDLGEAELEALAGRIRDSGADAVWIGLPTPKQEFLMRRLAPLVGATLIGVGAAFDFHAGTVPRAPAWMQRSGLEWLFRLGCEPRRLWRRYLIMAPQFLFALAAERGR